MRAITYDEARTWCAEQRGLDDDGYGLCYPEAQEHQFYVAAPPTFREMLFFSSTLLELSQLFSGGLVWLRMWDMVPFSAVGWHALENTRRAFGSTQSLEIAPAQLFREDEGEILQEFLLHVMGFGWVAEYVPCKGDFAVQFRSNGRLRIISPSTETLVNLKTALARWSPTDEDPMLQRMAQFEKDGQG